MDVWQSLLLVETHLTQQQMGHLTAPKEYVDHANETITRFVKVSILSSEGQITQLRLLQGLWQTLHNVFTPDDLKHVAVNILKVVLKHGFRIQEDKILLQWTKLCHALAQNQSPVDDMDFAGSWIILARVIKEVGHCPEGLITFLRLPIT